MLRASEKPPMLMTPSAAAAQAGHLQAERSSDTGAEARARASRECPKCESQSVARSRIRGWVGEATKQMFGLRPYRCLDCWHRFMATSRNA